MPETKPVIGRKEPARHRPIIYHAQAESLSQFDGNRYPENWLDDDQRLLSQSGIISTTSSLSQVQELHRQALVQSVRLYQPTLCGLQVSAVGLRRPADLTQRNSDLIWIPLPDADSDNVVTLSTG